jgi:hypothetical protein
VAENSTHLINYFPATAERRFGRESAATECPFDSGQFPQKEIPQLRCRLKYKNYRLFRACGPLGPWFDAASRIGVTVPSNHEAPDVDPP